MNEDNSDIIRTASLVIGYRQAGRVPLLPPLTFSASGGEMIAVAGRNGSGKSTLLKTLAGIINPLGGAVFIDGKDIDTYSRTDLALKTGYVATGPLRIPGMKVVDLVKLGRNPHTSWTGRLDETDYGMVEFAIENTGLRHLAGRYIDELSDGERQRAMIGRVVAQDTPVMILDEPTAFLDIRSRYEITDLLRRLASVNGRTILFSTHDLQTVFGICGRMMLLTGNEVIDGAPEDLAMNGSLDLLLGDPGLRFNPENASVIFNREAKDHVRVNGPAGIARHWTERTVQRSGYNPVSNDAALSICIEEDGRGIKWVCTGKGYAEPLTFSTLYEVGRWLETGRSL